jgi:hypothetical protein
MERMSKLQDASLGVNTTAVHDFQLGFVGHAHRHDHSAVQGMFQPLLTFSSLEAFGAEIVFGFSYTAITSLYLCNSALISSISASMF